MYREQETVERCFQVALGHTVNIEGGFSDHKNDSGGKTRWGITESTARRWGYTGDMRQLPRTLAETIYRVDYWQAVACDRICLLSGPIAQELFDTAVNCGQGIAGEFLQRLLNVFNRQQEDYADLKVDGKPGAVTMLAFTKFLHTRGATGELVMLKALNCLQGEHYVNLAEKKETQEDFVYGWIRARVTIG